jgi:NAD(P)-dependent dehydrogenase (short-subunit alcohol dehydrogenase family)
MGSREVLMERVLLISGATGIAEATARLAADRGQVPFLVAKDGPADHHANLCDELETAEAVKACILRYGRIDALFNVAGISGRRFGDGPVHRCTAEGWDAVFDNNVRSMFLLSKHVLQGWMESKQPGVILNMSSVLAFAPEPQNFDTHAYAASKGAIVALTTSMAAYYAPYQIRVNAIAPGLVRTPMSARAQADTLLQRHIQHKQPLSDGMLDAEDIARAAMFLLSDESIHITGQVLAVDGGWSVSS